MNLQQARHWFLSLAPRERRIVVGGAVVVIVMLAYFAVIEPLQERRAQLEREVAAQRSLLDWMNQVGGAVRAAGPARVGNGDSLFAVVDRSARATALAGALQRVQPEGQQTVRVWLENAAFDEIVRWIGALERDHGVSVSALTVERAQGSGLVNARLTLERP